PDFLAVKRTRPRLVGRSVKRTEPSAFVERGLAFTPAPVTRTMTPRIQVPAADFTVTVTCPPRFLRRLPVTEIVSLGRRLSVCAGEKSPTLLSASTPATRQ